MPLRLTRPLPAWRDACSARSIAAQARSSRAIASAISASLTISGGTQPRHIVAGADREQLLGAQRIDQLAVRHHARSPISRPSPRTSAITDGMPVLDLGEPLLEQQRDAGGRDRGSPA